MNIDIDLATRGMAVLISIGTAVYAYFASRRKYVDDLYGAASKRMNDQDNRIVALEQTVQAMPGKDDIHTLQLELVKQTGSLGEMRAVMEGNAKIMARLEAIVSRHEDHLLDGGKMK